MNRLRKRLRKPSASLRGRLDTAKAQDWRWKHFKRQEGRCAYCGRAMVLGPTNARNLATLDHVLPLSRGGLHHWENTVAACKACNHYKGDMTADEFLNSDALNESAPDRGAEREVRSE